MGVGEYVWGGALVALVSWELYAAARHPGWTLTSVTQRLFRVHTDAGRMVFAITWAVAAVLFGTHIALDWP